MKSKGVGLTTGLVTMVADVLFQSRSQKDSLIFPRTPSTELDYTRLGRGSVPSFSLFSMGPLFHVHQR